MQAVACSESVNQRCARWRERRRYEVHESAGTTATDGRAMGDGCDYL